MSAGSGSQSAQDPALPALGNEPEGETLENFSEKKASVAHPLETIASI